ncbi:hypothetical protein V8E36_004803 [Tilletia maclaganii]
MPAFHQSSAARMATSTRQQRDQHPVLDSAMFSDQRASSSGTLQEVDDDSDTDSTGNHRHLEATPARAVSTQDQLRLDRVRQKQPFSTATLDGIDISTAVHWLANKRIPHPHSQQTKAASPLPSPLPLPTGTPQATLHPLTSTQPQNRHRGLPDLYQSPILNMAHASAPSAPAHRSAVEPLLLPPQHSMRHQRGQMVAEPHARYAPAELPPPVPVPLPAPAPTITSARLPDLSGLTSAMGTPARPLQAAYHAALDPAFPGQRKRKVIRASAPAPLRQNSAPPQAVLKPHPLNLRARVETDEDSDDESATGESESIAHFPLSSTKAGIPASQQSVPENGNELAAAAGPAPRTANTSAATDSHPRIYLQGYDHPKHQIRDAAERAARGFGVEWDGPQPRPSAYALERRQQEAAATAAADAAAVMEEAQQLSDPAKLKQAPGESTAKLNHMHDELAKIVDRLGRLETENAGAYKQVGTGHRIVDPRTLLESDTEPDPSGMRGAFSRGAINNMQAHLRELMREMQRQRKALGALVELEQESVQDEIAAAERIQQVMGVARAPAQARVEEDGAAPARNAHLGAENVEPEREPRILASPKKGPQRTLHTSGNQAEGAQEGQSSGPLRWTGDARALHDRMDEVIHHVGLLRNEVRGGMPSGVDLRDRQAASSPILDRHVGSYFDAQHLDRPSSPFLRPSRAAGHARSSPPPAVSSAREHQDVLDEIKDADLSRIAAERAAEAFAKVREYSARGRAAGPSPPSQIPAQFRQAYADEGRPYQSSPDTGNQTQAPSYGPVLTQHGVDGTAVEHDERKCTVCNAPAKSAQRREARRERVRQEDRDKRRASGAAEAEEEEVLIDLLVEEAERHRQAQSSGGKMGGGATTDPFASWRDLIVLSPVQQASLTRMVKQHFDEFVHQRMLYAELADELKAVHPGMNAMRRRILGEHVMEAVELLEVKAERINVLQRLLGQGSADEEEWSDGQRGQAGDRRQAQAPSKSVETANAHQAGKGSRERRRKHQPSSNLRYEMETEPELESDYSDAEAELAAAEEEERATIRAAAAAAAARSSRRRGGRSPISMEDEDAPAPRPLSAASKGSARSSGGVKVGSSPPSRSGSARSARLRRGGEPTDYSPPTTLGPRELAHDLHDQDEQDDYSDSLDHEEEAMEGGRFGRQRQQNDGARPSSRQKRTAFSGLLDQGRTAASRGQGAGNPFGGRGDGRRSRR